jgi:hypothetical protein
MSHVTRTIWHPRRQFNEDSFIVRKFEIGGVSLVGSWSYMPHPYEYFYDTDAFNNVKYYFIITVPSLQIDL